MKTEESLDNKTTIIELKDMLENLISEGKGDYKVSLIIFTNYENGHETSDSKIIINDIDDEDKEVFLQGDS